MDFTNTSLFTFVEKIIEFKNIDEILDSLPNQASKGCIFERLWNIIIKFGFCSNFPNTHFTHKIGNANTGKLKILKNLNKYLLENKVYSSKSDGCSDITLQSKVDNTFIFISSKYPKTTDSSKSIEYYDIHKIIAVIDDNKEIYQKYLIYLLVPNKDEVLQLIKSSNDSSRYLIKYIQEDKILDKSDLNKYFIKFKKDILKNKKINTNIDYNELYLTLQTRIQLRFHQELITRKKVI